MNDSSGGRATYHVMEVGAKAGRWVDLDSPHRCVTLRPVGTSRREGGREEGLLGTRTWRAHAGRLESHAGRVRMRPPRFCCLRGRLATSRTAFMFRTGSVVGELSQCQYGFGHTSTVLSHRESFSLSLASGGQSHAPQGGGIGKVQCCQSAPVDSRFPGGAGGLNRQGVCVVMK